MRTIDEIRALKTAKFAALQGIEGVIGAGIGPQTAAPDTANLQILTETLGDNSLVVFFNSDHPEALASIAAVMGTDPFCAVPAGLNVANNPNAPTDPNNLSETIPKARKIVYDDSERTHLIGGIQLQSLFDIRDFEDLNNDIIVAERHLTGTLGCLVKTRDTNKIAALTCHHVLIDTDRTGELIADHGEKNFLLVPGFGQAGQNRRVATGDFQLIVNAKGRSILQHKPEGASAFKDVFSNTAADDEPRGSRSDNYRVGHPTAGNSCCCKDVIGRFYKSAYTRQIDAGIVLLREPATEFFLAPLFLFPAADVSDYRSELLGASGDENSPTSVTGTADISLADLQKQGTDGKWRLDGVVTKYGVRSKFTTGVIRAIEYTETEDVDGSGNPAPDLLFYIFPYDPATKQVVGDSMCRQGDSGSVAVRNNKIVGVLGRGAIDSVTGTGLRTHGVPIKTVSDRLNIDVLVSDGVTHTVPAGNFAGQPGLAPQLQQRAATVATTMRRIVPEIRVLISDDRQSMVAWHRGQGPTLARNLFWATSDPTWRIPERFKDAPAVDCIDGIVEVLAKRGTNALKRDLEQLRPLLRQLPGLTMTEFVDVLGAHPWP